MIQDEMRKELVEHLIPFWKGLLDEEFGGFYGYLDSGLQLDKKAVKGCILNSRILWFFSNAAMTLEDATLRKYADHAYAFLKDFCLDKERGGVYWSLTYDGQIDDSTKHTYNQAFAVYALSTYYRAFGVQEAIDIAAGIISVIETKCFDEYGYKEAQDIAFQPVVNDKLSENGIIADRTMNTLLHVVEAYTEYYMATKDKAVEKKLMWVLDMFANHIYNPKLHRQEVFFDNDMNSLIDLHSYGHDIETAWLLERTLEALDKEPYTKLVTPMIRDLENQIYTVAYKHNSIPYECEKGVVLEWRVWWAEAEAVVGFYNAYQKTGEKRYQEAAQNVWSFIQKYLIDKREGSEWYYEVDINGAPNLEEAIVEPWKCPYHNGRMCMEMIRRTK